MTDDKKPMAPLETEPDGGEMSEAEIDRNLADTFPASDPPSWTLGTDHAPASRNEARTESNGHRTMNDDE